MNIASDRFPGVAERRVPTAAGEIYLPTGGQGPPPQLHPRPHACWHKIAPELARRRTLAIADVPGDGASGAPSKRAMGGLLLAAAHALGEGRSFSAGHDREGRLVQDPLPDLRAVGERLFGQRAAARQEGVAEPADGGCRRGRPLPRRGEPAWHARSAGPLHTSVPSAA